MLLTISYSELRGPNYPRSVNKFLENYQFVYFLAVNKNKTKIYVVDNIIFRNSVA